MSTLQSSPGPDQVRPITRSMQSELSSGSSNNTIKKKMKLVLPSTKDTPSTSVSPPISNPLSSPAATLPLNGTSSSEPQAPPASPNSLIGILPNGVHVSHVPYSSAVKSAIKRALPTQGDVLKAANLTAQLTLQYMVRLNAVAQSKASVVNGSADATASLLPSPSSSASRHSSPVTSPGNPSLPVLANDPPILQKNERKRPVLLAKRRRYIFVEADSQNESHEEIPEFNYTRKHFKLDENPERMPQSLSQCSDSTAVTNMDHNTSHKSTKGKRVKQKKKLETDPTRKKRGAHSLRICAADPVEDNSTTGMACCTLQNRIEMKEENVSNSTSLSSTPLHSLSPSAAEESQLDLSRNVHREQIKQAGRSADVFKKKAKSLSPIINIKRVAGVIATNIETASDNPADVESLHTPHPTISNMGYVRRMASLNARACVSAILEADRYNTKSRKNNLSVSKKPLKPLTPNSTPLKEKVDKPSSTPLKEKVDNPSSTPLKEKVDNPSSSPLKEKVDNPSSSAMQWTSQQLAKQTQSEVSVDAVDHIIAPGQFICVNLDPSSSSDLAEEPPKFNTLGLLYNGGSIHPTKCRVFYSNNRTLSLPQFIVPTLVPSRVNCIADMIERVSRKRILRKLNKGMKDNNGWSPIGVPIKTLKLAQQSSPNCTRKYYIGIQRKKDFVCVRDCVLVKSEVEGKPFVAKVASIWDESDGLMMSLFWYYRPEEVLEKSAIIGACFQKNELLASQHYDTNSVACIEEKCCILGLKQYSRYQSHVVGNKSNLKCDYKQLHLVPQLPSRSQKTPYVSYEGSHDGDMSYVDLGPTMDELIVTDPSLIFICHRGYNHINGKLVTVSKSAK